MNRPLTRILVVDDDEHDAGEAAVRLFSVTPRELGGRTLVIEVCNDAFYVARQIEAAATPPRGGGTWDIIVSDLFMPGPKPLREGGQATPKLGELTHEGETFLFWKTSLANREPSPEQGGFHIAEAIRKVRRKGKGRSPKLILISNKLNRVDTQKLNDLLRAEASWLDYYPKPENPGHPSVEISPGAPALPREVFRNALVQAVQHLDSELWGQQPLFAALADGGGVFAKSPAMSEFILNLNDRVDRDAPVLLIEGEPSTGKSTMCALLRARLASRLERPDLRAEQIDCPTIFAADFQKSVAVARKNAPGGILFFKNVHWLRFEPFAQLLKLLKDQQSAHARSEAGARLIVCTARADLASWQDETRKLAPDFHALFADHYRLTMPALRERRDDIPELARETLRREGQTDVTLSRDALSWLQAQPWKNNLVELSLCVRVRAQTASKPELTAADFGGGSSPLISTPSAPVAAGKEEADAEITSSPTALESLVVYRDRLLVSVNKKKIELGTTRYVFVRALAQITKRKKDDGERVEPEELREEMWKLINELRDKHKSWFTGSNTSVWIKRVLNPSGGDKAEGLRDAARNIISATRKELTGNDAASPLLHAIPSGRRGWHDEGWILRIPQAAIEFE